MMASPNVRRLFRGLEQLYRSPTGIDPIDHLVSASFAGRPETLLVREAVDAVEVSLLLAPDVLERFEQHAPETALQSVGSSLPIIEGLSHLLYVFESARTQRPVSGLELETQAEVDKLAIHTLHRWPLTPEHYRELVDRLYYRFSLFPGMDDALRSRYVQANRVALAFSRRLLPHVVQRGLPGFRAALRRFWFAPMSDKRTLATTSS